MSMVTRGCQTPQRLTTTSRVPSPCGEGVPVAVVVVAWCGGGTASGGPGQPSALVPERLLVPARDDVDAVGVHGRHQHQTVRCGPEDLPLGGRRRRRPAGSERSPAARGASPTSVECAHRRQSVTKRACPWAMSRSGGRRCQGASLAAGRRALLLDAAQGTGSRRRLAALEMSKPRGRARRRWSRFRPSTHGDAGAGAVET